MLAEAIVRTDGSNGFGPPLPERPAVTTDVVVFSLMDDDLKVLLVKRRHAPYAATWAIPGGFVNLDESLEAAAARELVEETGVRDVYIEQLYAFGEPGRDPRGRIITIAYFALVLHAAVAPRAGDDAAEVGWHSMYSLPALAFDHRHILDYALAQLRHRLAFSTVGFELLPDTFTLTALQRAYEVILDEELDKRNFRRKMLSSGIVEETGQMKHNGEGRPARLYRYRPGAAPQGKPRRLFP